MITLDYLEYSYPDDGNHWNPPVRALHAPMDTTTMIGATDDQSHRHKV